MKTLLLIISMMVLFLSETNAQVFTNYTSFNTSTTLSSDYVSSIAIDADGNKWFAGNDGVSKFDGTNWTNYNIDDGFLEKSVCSIAIDLDGNLWVAKIWRSDILRPRGRGVSKFDGTTWTTYTTDDGLADNSVSSIAIDADGNIWIGHDNWDYGSGFGVSKFDGTTWTTYNTDDGLANNDVYAIAIDLDGNKWFGTVDGVSKYDGTNWTTFTKDGLASYNVTSIAIDADGNKWFGGWHLITKGYISYSCGGVSKYDGTTWTTYTIDDGLAHNSVRAITIDTDGNKWFGTADDGVSKFDGTTWTTYTEEEGLARNFVRSIAIDADGNKWFGFGGSGGVSKFDGTTWTTYTKMDGLVYNGVGSIAIDADGNKWFGTSGGVSKFDGTNWTTYTEQDGLADNHVNAIAIDTDGNKWFGTDNLPYGGRVSKFDGTAWTTYTMEDGLADHGVTSIAIDTDGNKWFGTVDGVSKLSDDNVGITPKLVTQNQLIIYPNPTKNTLTIETEIRGHYTIKIMALNGQELFSTSMDGNSMEIDMSAFKPGVFVLTLHSKEGVTTRKLIKL